MGATDSRTAPARLSGEEEAVYAALIRVVFAIPRAVSADIAPECGLALSEHLTLQMLSEAPGWRMRIAELATGCGVSISGMSRIAQRLEGKGLLRRVPNELDGRSADAVLTDVGRATLGQSRQAHLASVRSRIFDHLGELDLVRLASVLKAVADSAATRA